jgi:DNA-directed RNA polymerase subunit RPC12/RpoP
MGISTMRFVMSAKDSPPGVVSLGTAGVPPGPKAESRQAPPMPKFSCPTCEAEYDWTPELAGHKVRCANCGHKFVVGDAAESRPRQAHESGPVSDAASAPAPLPSARRRRPVPVGVLLGGLVAVAALAGAWWWFAGQPGQPKASQAPANHRRAAQPPANAKQDTAASPGKAIVIEDGAVVLEETAPPQDRETPPLYSGRDISGIESIVKSVENSSDPWRVEAEARIEKFRKADLELQIVDGQGHPVKDAEVRVVLRRHKFRFGGVVGVAGMFYQGKGRNARERKRVEDRMATANLRRTIFRYMGFNAAGFDNALKYKLRRGREPLLPAAFQWFRAHKIEVRGHCLIWPGTKHLPSELAKLVQAGDKEAVRRGSEKMVAEWASKWDVIEWDVINETRGNHAIQDMLGREVMADWFKIARKNAVNPNCRFDLNENSVISDRKSGAVTDHMKKYRAELEFLVEHGAPVDSIGFQSRFHRMAEATEIYQRLCWFEDFNLPITATEFETKESVGSELDRAVMTERVMSVYFSHRLVDGIFAWSLFPPADGREILDADGRPNLRGKVWLYLMKNRWTTDESLRTGAAGNVTLRAFKGEYDISVSRNGRTKHFRTRLDAPLSAKIVW